MNNFKAYLDGKEQLRMRVAIIREKHRRIVNLFDRSIRKEIGWFTPPNNQDGQLNSI